MTDIGLPSAESRTGGSIPPEKWTILTKDITAKVNEASCRQIMSTDIPTPSAQDKSAEKRGRRITWEEAEEIAQKMSESANEGLQRERERDAELSSCLDCKEKEEHVRSLQRQNAVLLANEKNIKRLVAFAMQNGNAALQGKQDTTNALHHMMTALCSFHFSDE